MTEVVPPPGLQKTMGIAAIRSSISRALSGCGNFSISGPAYRFRELAG
ncbi:hypothetical protein ACIG56_24295 [Nocardia fusca]